MALWNVDADEGVELAISTRKNSQEDSDRIVVKPVGEDDLTAMLSHRLDLAYG